MNEDELEAIASGNFEQPAPEVEEQADDVEQEEYVDEPQPEEPEELEPEEEGEPEPKEEKPKMSRASQRVKEAVDRANDLERRMQERDFKINQLMEANEKLMGMITGDGQDAEPDEQEEVLDEVLAKKMEEKFGKLEDQQFNTVKAQELNLIGGTQGETYNKAVAAVAIEIMQNENLYGRKVDDVAAEKAAIDHINAQMRNMHKGGAQHGAIATALAHKAQYYDMFAASNKQSAGQPAKKGVNMSKVAEARKTAGAPTTERDSANPNGGTNPLAGFYKRAEESGLKQTDLAKWGF